MRKLVALFFALTFATWALAQQSVPLTGAGGKFHVLSATYTGPADVVASPGAWWGLRAMSAADRGNKLIQVCNALDVACADWSSDPTTGLLVASTVGLTNCTLVNTCTIKTFYDRSGAALCSGVCDVSQATPASRATLTFSCLNSLPCAVFAGGQRYVSGTIAASQAQPFTFSAVTIRTANFTTSQTFVTPDLTGTALSFNFRQIASAVQMFAGTGAQFISNITDSNFHALQGLFNGASSFLMCGGGAGTGCSAAGVDNSISPGATGITGGTSNPFILGNNGTSTQPLSGQMTEAGYWPIGFSGTQRTNMTANQYTFWGPF